MQFTNLDVIARYKVPKQSPLAAYEIATSPSAPRNDRRESLTHGLTSLASGDKGIDLPSAHQHQGKPDKHRCPHKLGQINAGVGAQAMKYVLRPVGKVMSLKGKPVEGPEEGLRSKPHLIENQVGEGAEGKDKEPVYPAAPVEVKTSNGDDDEKQERVAKYPAVADSIPEEELAYGLVNDVREKRAYEKKPHI